MTRLILPTVALALMLAAPAAAHDTGLDGLYTETDDDAHVCHHLRVDFWNDMIGRGLSEIWLLRYDHARPKQHDARQSELVRKSVRSRRRGLEAQRKSFAVLQRQAKRHGCGPWPPSGGNER